MASQLQLLWRMSAVLVLLVYCGAQGGTADPTPARIVGSKSALGKLVNLPKTDILDNLDSGYLLFTVDPVSTTEPHSRGESNTQYFETSNEFRQQISVEAGLDASYASVSISMETTFNKISGFETDVSVAKAYAQALVSVTSVSNDNLDKLELRPDFLSEFKALPVTIQNEWQASAWIEIAEFLETWGTHVIVAAYTGAAFETYSAAKSSLKYSQWQLEARACLKAEGLKTAVQGCAGYSNEEKNSAARLDATDKRYAKGATAATRNALLTQEVTADAIEAFLNEAAVDEQPVRYKFLPLWSLLRRKFQARSDDWRRATNLGAYYDGWLGFGCKHLEMKANGLVETAQRFLFDLSNTGYAKCLRRCLGCHSYYLDCFGWNGQCVCAGPSCLVPVRDGDGAKPGYHVRVEDDRRKGWGGMGCTYEGGDCVCGNTNYEVGCNIQLDDNKYLKYVALWDQTPTTRTIEDPDIDIVPLANATIAAT